MKAAIITPGRDVSETIDYLHELDKDLNPEVWPDIESPESISAALVWKAPSSVLKEFKNLKLVCSFGAGVDHLVNNTGIPATAAITRLVDPALAQSVMKYCLMTIFSYEKNFREHILNQSDGVWKWMDDRHKPVIGVLGMGVIGLEIASKLNYHGYQVNGYSSSPKTIDGINHYHAGQLEEFLHQSDILINILPLTKATTGFYNRDFFMMCKQGTYFINVGRGSHVVDKDLLEAIHSGVISGATLDVFSEEPLPSDHLYWKQKQITITPHIAGLTAPRSAAVQFYENFMRLKEGKPLLNEVDRSKGY